MIAMPTNVDLKIVTKYVFIPKYFALRLNT